MDYIIKQRVESTSSLPPQPKMNQGMHALTIASKGGQYGILTERGEAFLPFEYDNISVCGFGLLQTIQQGKMGLVHISDDGKSGFILEKVIACEYDFLDFQRQENYVILRQDLEESACYRVYFPKRKELSEQCSNVFVVDHEYVELCGQHFRKVENAESGVVVSGDAEYICVGAYNVECGKVLQELSHRTGKNRLVFMDYSEQMAELIGAEMLDGLLDKPRVKIVDFCGDCRAVFSLEDDGVPVANAFIVGTEEGLLVLDDVGNALSEKRFTSITANTQLHSKNRRTGEKEEIELYAPSAFWHAES